MAEMTSPNDVRYLNTATSSAKRAVPNVSSGWMIMLLSGLVAMAIFLFATRQGDQQYAVGVVDHRIEIGQPVPENAIRKAEIDVDKEQLEGLIRYDDRKSFAGWIATSQLEAGDLINKSVLRKPAGPDGNRSMSIAVERSHANGGDLHAGDKVDVIDSSVTPSVYVAKNIEVLSVNNPPSNAIGASAAGFSVTVAVDADTAARLSQTMNANKFDVVRSTGAIAITNQQ